MISCIICSRRPDISAELKENIATTIGCEYELVVIDNSKNEYSIFSAYNEGVRRAKGDILCFMHEDILYHTQGWGIKVAEYFVQYPQAGLIGVAGTHYLSSIPSGWWETDCISCYIKQGFNINGIYQFRMDDVRFYQSNPTYVVALDGVWMCMVSSMFDYIQWDEHNFSGFHGYDIDMSLQVWNAGKEVHIIWDLLLEHKSSGCANHEFYNNCEILWKKWKNEFPIMKGVNLSIPEEKVRTKLVELNRIIRIQEDEIYRINNICQSYAYRLCSLILTPIKKIRKWLK